MPRTPQDNAVSEVHDEVSHGWDDDGSK